MKKFISLALALVMLMTVLPFSAFADESYSITCTGCVATLDETYYSSYTVAEAAEAGQTVYLVPDISDDKYVESYTCTTDDVEMSFNSFVMPAHPVTINAVTGEKQELTLDFTDGYIETDSLIVSILTDNFTIVEKSGEYKDAEGGFDFDGDEVADVDFSTEKGMIAVTQNGRKENYESASSEIDDPYSSYSRITLNFNLAAANTHTVIWKLDDGTEFARAQVPDGVTVNCEKTPVKAGTDEYYYVFKGWTPEEGAVTSDTTYTAVFEQKVRMRTVTWKNWDGKVIKTVTIPVTETPVYGLSKPTKNSDAKYKYTFSKWNAVVDKTTGDTVYTAEFTKKAIPIKLTASNKTFKQTTKTKKYTVTLKIDGKAARNKKLTVVVNGKTYTAKTNKKGQATFVFKITKKGKYNATVKYKGNPKNITKKVKITVK